MSQIVIDLINAVVTWIPFSDYPHLEWAVVLLVW